MKRLFCILLPICLFMLSACESSSAAEALSENARNETISAALKNISETNSDEGAETEMKRVPDSYKERSERAGNVIRIDYKTTVYDDVQDKHAYAYLPYGYDENDNSTRYNILYLMHGGGGSAEHYLGGENGDSELKRVLDNMIAEEDIPPMIVVTPSFYPNHINTGNEGELTRDFHSELITDLVPAVENKLHTYAEKTDLDGLQKSRSHRAFGGFSMGSVTTWYTFINCLDYFKYYMPMSGDCWLYGQMGSGDTNYKKTASYLDEVAEKSGYGVTDYYIYAVTGTEDIAYAPLSGLVEAMQGHGKRFIYSSDFTKGNFYYGVVEGDRHDYPSMLNYIYNALPNFGFEEE